MAANPPVGLRQLSAEELADLRLAAQIMAHRAQLGGRPAVVLYFDSLEAAVMAAEAARGQVGPAAPSEPIEPAPSGLSAGHEDDRLIGECLDLLCGNERLSGAVREYCAGLAAARAKARIER